jgi:nucleoside 2-deoxyribosyltransferase
MQPPTDAAPRRPGVYLAGPTVFEADPAPLFGLMKKICARHGLEGISPLDNQIGLEGRPSGRALATAIVRADITLMQRVDAGVFCLDGFRRGPEMDPGTAFEIGYMHALGKPLAGWTRDVRSYPERVASFFADVFGLSLTAAGTGAQGGTSGTARDPDGILVHSDGCYQNAMTQMGIELSGGPGGEGQVSGGQVCADPVWTVAFERAVANLAARSRG